MTLEGLAKIAHLSPYHFHRLFTAVMGESLHQYIRRLRLEVAAKKLRYTDLPVTTIGLDAQYDTPSAFTKAFKQVMGQVPKQYRTLEPALNTIYERYTHLEPISPTQIGSHFQPIEVLFIRKQGDYTQSAPREAWEQVFRYIHSHHLKSASLRKFGVFHDDPTITTGKCQRYDAAICVPGARPKGEMGTRKIQGGRYAQFTHMGAHDLLEETFHRILCTWFFSSNYQFDETRPDFCEYLHFDQLDPDRDRLVTHIYIPLAESRFS